MTYQTLCLFYLPKPSLDLGIDISWYHADLTQKLWPQGLFEVNAVCFGSLRFLFLSLLPLFFQKVAFLCFLELLGVTYRVLVKYGAWC